MAQQKTSDVGDSRLWHPFSDMSGVPGNELRIERGEDVWLWTDDGRKFLDASASLWYTNVGHGRTEIADAVAQQMKQIETYSIFGDTTTGSAEDLARRLSDLSPLEDARVFLTTGGGESIDTAAKISRRFWAVTGQPQRQHLIGRIGGYHGTNGFGTSVGGMEENRAGFGTLIPNTSYVPYDSVEALEREIDRIGAENVAAFFMEPVTGAGGVYAPPEGYVEGVAEVCAATGVLFIVDSVICAFGRLGTWFGIERWGVEPDMITFAKGVSSGYTPVGGVVASWRVAEPFYDGTAGLLRHGATYAGHAACAAGALANLDILERENLVTRGAELEGTFADVLRPLEDHPLVAEVRAGTGLLAAVEMVAPSLVKPLYAALREEGIFSRALGSAIALSPPLTIQQPEIDMIGSAMSSALDAVLEKSDIAASALADRA